MATEIVSAKTWNHCQPGETYVEVQIWIETYGKRYRAFVRQERGSHQGYFSPWHDEIIRALGVTPEAALDAVLTIDFRYGVYDEETFDRAVSAIRSKLAAAEVA